MSVENDGNAIKDIFFLVRSDPNKPVVTLDLPATTIKNCCDDYTIKVYANTGDADEFKDDKTSFLFKFESIVSGAVLTLQQFIDGTWTDVDTLNNTDNGIFYSYGFYTNSYEEKYIGYQIYWRNVLISFGAGSFRVKCAATISIGGSNTQYTNTFCLFVYTPERVDKTIKIEYYNNRLTGDKSDDKKFFDYGELNWYNALRIPGFFGYPSSAFESNYVQYNTGLRVEYEDKQEPEYTFKSMPIPAYVLKIIQYDILQADRILITDYNNNNAEEWIQKEVQRTSAFNPNWKPLQNKLASVELKFRQSYNHLTKRFS